MYADKIIELIDQKLSKRMYVLISLIMYTVGSVAFYMSLQVQQTDRVGLIQNLPVLSAVPLNIVATTNVPVKYSILDNDRCVNAMESRDMDPEGIFLASELVWLKGYCKVQYSSLDVVIVSKDALISNNLMLESLVKQNNNLRSILEFK